MPMRRQILSFVVLCVIAISFTACDNGPYSSAAGLIQPGAVNPLYVPPGAGSVQGTCVCIDPMSANIDGATWKSDTNASYVTLNSIPMIHGVDSAGKYMVSLYLYNYTGPGTYYYGSGVPNQAVVVDGSTLYTTAVGSGAGVIVVSSDMNNKMQAKFSFTAYTADGQKKHVVNGGWANVKKM